MDLNNFKTELEGYLSKLSGNTRIPVGQPWWGFDPKSKPAGVQLFAGQELSRAAYQKHWELISSGKRTLVTESDWQSYVSQNGFCPYYSSGDGSTTYRMPLVKNVHPEFVSALIDAGQYIEAGLPNITGFTGTPYYNTDYLNGAFRLESYGVVSLSGGTSATMQGASFDASRSNSIYGNSDTVQPPSLTFLIGEYVISSVATIGEADKNSILEMINKLEINISDMIKSVNGVGADSNGNIDVISLMMPDYSAGVSHTATKTEASFTAPSNGVITVDLAGFNNVYCYLKINGQIMFNKTSNGNNWIIGATGEYPVSKGDVITYKDGYSTSGANFSATASVVFYPLKGV